jgi:hypothetical protein
MRGRCSIHFFVAIRWIFAYDALEFKAGSGAGGTEFEALKGQQPSQSGNGMFLNRARTLPGKLPKVASVFRSYKAGGMAGFPQSGSWVGLVCRGDLEKGRIFVLG